MPSQNSGIAYVIIENDVRPWSLMPPRAQPAVMPESTPKMVESTRGDADERDRRPGGVADLRDHGRIRLVRAAEVEMGELDEVVPELVELRAVEAELVLELVTLRLGQAASAKERAHRIRLDDPEQEEVEDDDERQRPERAEDLALTCRALNGAGYACARRWDRAVHALRARAARPRRAP